ncbi:MAG: 4Fe-4S dicluster domain-containing protein [Desulfovibrio sp.]|jgi:ferredoxin|nr:4Fe-4S dicluster domain-containing protein [Desulfovibrio sp.]
MSIQEELQAVIKEALPDVSCVIGWREGPEPLRAAPLFVRTPADADAFRSGYFAVNNPAVFLPEYKGGKVGVVVKGCDARSVGQLLAEGLIRREEVKVIGFPCNGVIDVDKVAVALAGACDPGEIQAAREEGDELVLTTPSGEIRLRKTAVTADKCGRCLFPNALDADVFVGDTLEPAVSADDYADVAAFEALSLEKRMDFWEQEMSRCVRCYACRNACPMCVCREHCVALSRDPRWLTQSDGVRDKMFFQIIHASHLAGRCTGCGECQRACPARIPVLLLKRALSRRVEDLFAYRAGVDVAGPPPLLSFALEEPKIKERDW